VEITNVLGYAVPLLVNLLNVWITNKGNMHQYRLRADNKVNSTSNTSTYYWL